MPYAKGTLDPLINSFHHVGFIGQFIWPMHGSFALHSGWYTWTLPFAEQCSNLMQIRHILWVFVGQWPKRKEPHKHNALLFYSYSVPWAFCVSHMPTCQWANSPSPIQQPRGCPLAKHGHNSPVKAYWSNIRKVTILTYLLPVRMESSLLEFHWYKHDPWHSDIPVSMHQYNSPVETHWLSMSTITLWKPNLPNMSIVAQWKSIQCRCGMSTTAQCKLIC